MGYVVFFLICICVIAWLVMHNIGDGKSTVCTRCESIGTGKSKVNGNIAIEIVLWLCFIIPGLIYTIWRSYSRHRVCAQCGSADLVPIDSPLGERIINGSRK